MHPPVHCGRCGHQVPFEKALVEHHPGCGLYVHYQCADMRLVLIPDGEGGWEWGA